LADLQTAAEAISESQVELGTLSSQIMGTLSTFVNEAAEALGIGVEVQVEDLTEEEATDEEKVQAKLDEINAKLSAIREAMETEDVVIKSWFEGE